MLKSFAPTKNESMANLFLDQACMAPKEISSDYLSMIKDADKIMNTPAVELYSNILGSLVKK